MEHYDELFLDALGAALKNEKVCWNGEISPEDWIALFRQAGVHNVMPLIYDAVYRCPAAKLLPDAFLEPYKKKTIHQVMTQTMKTADFLRLQSHLKKQGVTLLVVKGIICRSIYPNPDHRISCDEDILVYQEQFVSCQRKMNRYGMQRLDPNQEVETAYEVSYGKTGSPLHIELHKSLFSPESEAYGEWNRFFEDVFEHMVSVEIEGEWVTTMGYTDHLFYLICHAFKHFLHSGFGIRQVCDIVMFANAYGTEIDWHRVLVQCREIRADRFSAALFRIGEKFLTFSPEAACLPTEWTDMEVDETALLEDLLSGGVYGDSSMSRKHSSNMTLNAVAAAKRGEKAGPKVLSVVFPPVKKLEGRYSYLKKHPSLLPVAWADRIVKYGIETSTMSRNHAAESIRIGNQRIQLLKQYGVIPAEDE
ncbi:MAG: nucleotidyltransferase family protein [Lachnospiraceae bacterium]